VAVGFYGVLHAGDCNANQGLTRVRNRDSMGCG
jgi:hypothetical protein